MLNKRTIRTLESCYTKERIYKHAFVGNTRWPSHPINHDGRTI